MVWGACEKQENALESSDETQVTRLKLLDSLNATRRFSQVKSAFNREYSLSTQINFGYDLDNFFTNLE